MLYESMLVFGIAMGAGLVFSISAGMRSAMDQRRPLLLAFLVVVLGIYFVWCWMRGQTLAMKTWGIRVVDRQGRPLASYASEVAPTSAPLVAAVERALAAN